MSNEKKDAIRRKLQQSRNATLEVAQELEREDWSHLVYSHDGGWNASDLLRHLTWAESGMLRLVKMIRESGSLVLLEGIETHTQARIALETEADLLQGFLFARPAPPDDVAPLLDRTLPL